MPTIAPGAGRVRRLKQDLIDMKALTEKCPAIKFRTLDDGDAPEKYEVSFYIRTIIGVEDDKPVYREADMPSVFIFDLSDYPFKHVKTYSVSLPKPFHPNFNDCGQFDFSLSEECFGGRPLASMVIQVAKSLQFEYIRFNSFNTNAENWIKNINQEDFFPCDKTNIPHYSDIICKPTNYYWVRYMRRGY